MSEDSKESTALEDIVSEYIEVRDQVRAITREYETKVEGLKTRKDKLKAKLLEVCRSIGADSIKTQIGTISRSVKETFRANDWNSMYNFVEENEAYHLLEKRIHQSNMKEFYAENKKLPKGMDVFREYTIRVTAKRKGN
jgi:capsule polysaccharide export protein KpsE/RkpR